MMRGREHSAGMLTYIRSGYGDQSIVGRINKHCHSVQASERCGSTEVQTMSGLCDTDSKELAIKIVF